MNVPFNHFDYPARFNDPFFYAAENDAYRQDDKTSVPTKYNSTVNQIGADRDPFFPSVLLSAAMTLRVPCAISI